MLDLRRSTPSVLCVHALTLISRLLTSPRDSSRTSALLISGLHGGCAEPQAFLNLEARPDLMASRHPSPSSERTRYPVTTMMGTGSGQGVAPHAYHAADPDHSSRL